MNSNGDSKGFLDLLLNLLVGFFFLFVISFMMIKIQEKDAEIQKPHVEYLLTINWPDYAPDDVDVYIQDPKGNITWYRRREVGLVHIDRDDKGTVGDTFESTEKQQVIQNIRNQEIVSIRGFIEGRWIINIHLFSNESKEPVPVDLTFQKLNPSVRTVLSKKIILKRKWHEVPFISFEMDKEGNMFNKNEVYFKSLVDEVGIIQSGHDIRRDTGGF